MLNAIYNFGYEYVQRYFNPIERYRAIEFERDWNRPTNAPINTDQHVGIAQVGLQNGNKSKLLYGISFFDEGSFYKGLKHSITSFYKTKNSYAEYNGSYLTSNYNLLSSNFYRHKTLLSKSFWKLTSVGSWFISAVNLVISASNFIISGLLTSPLFIDAVN